ncbi:MAG: hypothetical protein QXV32_09035 [Conexivisphaerales archaeon]
MKKQKIWLYLLFFFFSFYLLFAVLPITSSSTTTTEASATACYPASSPFAVQSASWANQQGSASPGQLNVPIAVTLVYTGGCQLTWASFQVQLSKPFSSTSNTATITDYQVNIPSYSQFQLLYSVNIAENASLGIYQIPLTITYNTQNFTGYVQSTSFSISLLGSASITAVASSSLLLPATTNNLQLNVQNTGSGNASQVTVSLSQPVQGIALTSSIQKIPQLPSNSSYPITLQLYVSNSLSQQAVNLPLTITYYNQYGSLESEQIILGFYVAQSSYNPQLNYLSVSTLTPSITIGQKSLLMIEVNNTGSSTLFSPVFSLNMPSGFAVVQNSTFSNSNIAIPAHSSFIYEAWVVSGPKVAEGAYTGQLILSYLDSKGNTYTSTLPVGFLVTGSVQITTQSVSYSSSANSLTFSGTLLNQGSASAYYLQVYGKLTYGAISQTSGSYVGEVDPNTPVPFSLTFTLPQLQTNNQAILQLNITYMNDFGSTFQQSIPAQSFQVQLNTTQNNPNTASSQTGTLQILRYLIILVILVAVGAAVIYGLRRKQKGEEKVI